MVKKLRVRKRFGRRFKGKGKSMAAKRMHRSEMNGLYYISQIREKGFLKIRATDLIKIGNANVESAVQYALTNPSAYLSTNGGSFGGTATDWTSITNIYDTYRVMGVKFIITPCYSGEYAQSTTAPNATAQLQPFIAYVDIDQGAATSGSQGNAVHYDNVKYLSRTHQSVIYVKLPKYAISGYPVGYIDSAGPSNLSSLWIVMPAIDSTSAATNIPQMTVSVEWYIEFRGRK